MSGTRRGGCTGVRTTLYSLFSAGELRTGVHTSELANEQAIQKVTLQVRAQLAAQASMKSQSSPKREDNADTTALQGEEPTRPPPQGEEPTRPPPQGEGLAPEPGRTPKAASAPQDAKATANVVAREQERQRVGPPGSEVTRGSPQTNAEPSKPLDDTQTQNQRNAAEGARPEGRGPGGAGQTTVTVRASLKLLAVGRPTPPTITLEPLSTRGGPGGPGSGDEVQSMEVR